MMPLTTHKQNTVYSMQEKYLIDKYMRTNQHDKSSIAKNKVGVLKERRIKIKEKH